MFLLHSKNQEVCKLYLFLVSSPPHRSFVYPRATRSLALRSITFSSPRLTMVYFIDFSRFLVTFACLIIIYSESLIKIALLPIRIKSEPVQHHRCRKHKTVIVRLSIGTTTLIYSSILWKSKVFFFFLPS